MSRTKPNIIVTGTPGVGKTSHCDVLAQNTGLRHIRINDVVKDQNCHEGWDDEHQSYIVDDDKLLDALENEIPQGGYLIDWHACELFPRSWIDLVVVLRTNSTVLYDRLRSRKYPEKKLQENLDSEIMEVLLEEARDSYDEEIVIELQSDEADDIDANTERIETWIQNWTQNQLSATADKT